MNAENAELLKSVIADSKSLNTVNLSGSMSLGAESAYILSQAASQNQFITTFGVGGVLKGYTWTAFNAPLLRNNARLNRAARFVLRRNTGKACAEAFELFQAQPSLMERVKEASGMSDRDAEAAVMSSKQFISDNYFFINQVVRDNLECLPGEGTQIDQLNADCWRYITGYLKVSDVIVVH